MSLLKIIETDAVEITDVEEQIEALARDIEITTAVSAWRIGESLARARELHRYKRGGGFATWARDRLCMSEPQANRFIHVYENLDPAKAIGFDRLSREALFALAAPSTDDAIRDEVERRLAEGQRVTAAQIEALRREAAEQRDRADTAQRQADRRSAV